ncbi:MAG: hypothetical protein E7314_05520 [Clostridiales bacterium]|nr:hypothetical protein [Clostridiales bacterium]
MVTDAGKMMFSFSKMIVEACGWQLTDVDYLIISLQISCLLLIALLEILYCKEVNEEIAYCESKMN